MIEFLAEEAERPVVSKIRDHFAVTFHPNSAAMKAFEHGDDEDRMIPQEPTQFDPDADFPFPGLDAPFGG